MADLSSLLASSRALNSQLSRPELPQVHLSLQQIEAQSRRLVSRQPQLGSADDANYLLAQAQINAANLSSSVAHLNTTTATTFTPLQALQDTDLAGYLRAVHEQTLISTIEESRKQTQNDFYQMLSDRMNKDWENMKTRIWEELGSGSAPPTRRTVVPSTSALPAPTLSLQMQTKMMAYDRVIMDLNNARLKGSTFPILHRLIDAATSLSTDPPTFPAALHTLAHITSEPSALPALDHANANILNAPLLQGKFTRAYASLGTESKTSTDLRKTITRGALASLESQYFSIVNRTIASHATEARLGGDPSVENKIRAFVVVRFWRGGEWVGGVELIAGTPLYAHIFFLIRTGHLSHALTLAQKHTEHLERKDPGFVGFLRAWIEGGRRIAKTNLPHLQVAYNSHMIRHSSSSSSREDPFKLALYKLIGKLERNRRTVEGVTETMEDWMWFQLGMLDEDEQSESPQSQCGLQSLSELVLSYGERHFDPDAAKGAATGKWAQVLVMCGEFERAVAALHAHTNTHPEAVHLAIGLAYHGLVRVSRRAEEGEGILNISPVHGPSISFSTMIWRYVRQFVKMDPKEALQYVFTITLTADQATLQTQPLQGGDSAGKEQIESTWELVRRIIVLANPTSSTSSTGSNPAWEELVGGFRPDGTRFTGFIEQNSSLLSLSNTNTYNTEILLPTAQTCFQNSQISEAIRLFNLAGDYTTVVSCLASALGTLVAQTGAGGGSIDEKGRALEKTAREILRHYERTNRASGKEREAVGVLLRIREVVEARTMGRPELVLEIMESVDLVPLDGDVAKITRRAEEFRDLHESLQRNLPTYVTITMDAIAGVHQNVKHGMVSDAVRGVTLAALRKKSRSLMVFAGMLKYRMSPDVYSYLARLDVEIAL